MYRNQNDDPMTKKEEVLNLWRICFNDTEDFLRLYFERKYSDADTAVLRENGRIVSALQMLPYPMTWYGKTVMTSYISGACTHPSFRSGGLMRKLLTEAFLTMKSRKTAFSVLIPQEPRLYDYYARAGYAPVLAYTPENYYLSVRNDNPAVSFPAREELRPEELYPYFRAQMEKRKNCVQHPAEDFRTVLDELYLSGGSLLLLKDARGQIGGMAFALPCPDKILINELLYESDSGKEALLQAAAHKWGKGEIECRVPVGSGRKAAPKGMARIIDAFQVLSVYASTHPRKTLFLRINDPDIPSNNGYYRLMNGRTFRTGAGIHKTDHDLDIGELTRMLFALPSHISLMLE